MRISEAISKTVVIYPGRFHPFHKGHASVYAYLKNKFDTVYITTSNKIDPPKSPFSFAEKRAMMVHAGIPAGAIVQSAQPYRAEEILRNFDPSTTSVAFAVSEKDMEEDPRFSFRPKKDGSPSYFQAMPKDEGTMVGFDTHGYITTVPTLDFTVSGEPMRSATELRQNFAKADDETQKSMIIDLYGAYDEDIHNIMRNKIKEHADPYTHHITAAESVFADLNTLYEHKQFDTATVLEHANKIVDRINSIPVVETLDYLDPNDVMDSIVAVPGVGTMSIKGLMSNILEKMKELTAMADKGTPTAFRDIKYRMDSNIIGVMMDALVNAFDDIENIRRKGGTNSKSIPKDVFDSVLHMHEAWSAKYKRSINCNNPKGFSQRAHCAGRKKTEGLIKEDEEFLYGDCPIFAIALSRMSGLPLKAMLDYSDELDTTVLVHAFVGYKDGLVIDASGVRSIESIEDDYPVEDDPYVTDISEKDLLALGYDGNCPTMDSANAHAEKVLADIKEVSEAKRIARKKGQKANSKKHSDLYTDENPKGTIQGLKFATVKDAEASVNKIKNSGKTHAHKIQAAVAMEQRAKAADKKSAAAVYRRYINAMKKKTDETKEAPPGTYFTKSGNLVKGKLTKDAKERGARQTDPKDKQRSKVPAVSQYNEQTLHEYVFQSIPLRVLDNLSSRKDNKPFPIKTGDTPDEVFNVTPEIARKFMNVYYQKEPEVQKAIDKTLNNPRKFIELFTNIMLGKKVSGAAPTDIAPDKLTADVNEAGVGIITKQNATKDAPIGSEYSNVKKLGLGSGKPKLHDKKATKNSDPNTLFNLGLAEIYTPLAIAIMEGGHSLPELDEDMAGFLDNILAKKKTDTTPKTAIDQINTQLAKQRKQRESELKAKLYKLTRQAMNLPAGSEAQRNVIDVMNPVRKALKLNPIAEAVSQVDIDQLERFADKMFAKVGIDVEFGSHFMDRVNDERNGKPITPAELTRLFKQEYKRYGKPIAQMGPEQQAVMKDLQTDINIPFMLKWDADNNELDLIAKTVMRKKDFKTSNKEFAVERGGINVPFASGNFASIVPHRALKIKKPTPGRLSYEQPKDNRKRNN